METSLIREIIKKFLEGNCSDEEFAYLLYWYESFDENVPVKLTDEEKESLRMNILEHIKSNIPELETSEKRAKTIKITGRKGVFIRSWKYAAAAVIIGISVWISFSWFGQKQYGHLAKTGQIQIKTDLVTLINRSDQVQLVVLPDSSKVWLSPESSIHYNDKFTSTERKVQLTGEAFFDIRHNAFRPFIVISQHLMTTVLGTSFLIKTNTDGTGEVTVLSGKVVVEKRDHKKDKIILIAKQSVILNTGSKLVKGTGIDKGILQKWQKINLSFDNAPFEQVIQILDKRFGVRMYCLDDKIYQYKLNADFNNQNLADILEMLGTSLNIHYKMINDSTISFYEKIDTKE
ncbi:MAG: FecR family protein [Chitinophagaceae bacterium]|nr:MAG: FecR family protein [Chitinophagaceae bacterium]